MNRAMSGAVCAFAVLGLMMSGGCGGGGGTTSSSLPPASLNITPSSVTFGAIGSTTQLTAVYKDANGATVTGAAVVFARAGAGTNASVSASGLVTALAVGAGDTAVATGNGFTARAPISVTQVVASITVSSAGIDTLKNTGGKKTYTAVVKDSNLNVIGSASVNWTSSNTAVATVNAGTGVATAVTDGNTNITAASGTVNGLKALVVRRVASTFSLVPNTPQTITVNGGTLSFTGTAQDTVPTNLTITWTSRNTAVLTLSPASGASPSTGTATATGNGSTYVVMAGGTKSDSSQVTVSNQTSTAPMTAAVTVGDDFFTSVHNGTANPAIDTIAVGGQVTWTWGTGATNHSVESTGSPSFTSSAQKSGAGQSYNIVFASAGTYTYDCVVHGNKMTGSIVVR